MPPCNNAISPASPMNNFSERSKQSGARYGSETDLKHGKLDVGLPLSIRHRPRRGGRRLGARKRHSEWVDLGYSITSSARASSICGTLNPSAPMTRSLCGGERLPSPKLGNFLLCHAG